MIRQGTFTKEESNHLDTVSAQLDKGKGKNKSSEIKDSRYFFSILNKICIHLFCDLSSRHNPKDIKASNTQPSALKFKNVSSTKSS